MRKNKPTIAILGLILIGLLFIGCKDLLIPGTFVLVNEFDFTAEGGIYYESINITEDEDWQDNKDKIDFVDAVGVEFFITSEEEANVTFDVYVDDYAELFAYPTTIPTTATHIIDGLIVEPGETHITYKQSLGFLTGIDRLKELAKLGQFNFYGESSGSDGTSFFIDSAKIIVTISASEK